MREDTSEKQDPINLSDKNEVINEIEAHDKESYELWLRKVGKSPHFWDMPLDSARYVCIPKPIFDIADDPSKVNLIDIPNPNDSEIEVLVVERKSEPQSDEQKLAEYWKSVDEFKKTRKLGEKKPRPPVPKEVNPFHASQRALMESGELSIYDFVYNRIGFRKVDEDQLYCSIYEDNPILQRRGVATAFIERFNEVAIEMGFRFIVGYILDENNLSFFQKRLGGYRLGAIKETLRQEFMSQIDERELKKYTIYFLYPEDKEKYLNSAVET